MKEIEDLIKKAERFLRTAELILDDGDYDSCVSRCYYAMFFMAEAILIVHIFQIWLQSEIPRLRFGVQGR
ncbi:MAG: HEPN domain-containing protein [Halobacteriota archaeon]|nr:HEPN domain-containing protein [Halobacteriota archaeon]